MVILRRIEMEEDDDLGPLVGIAIVLLFSVIPCAYSFLKDFIAPEFL